jgi:hypothetical protein
MGHVADDRIVNNNTDLTLRSHLLSHFDATGILTQHSSTGHSNNNVDIFTCRMGS